MQLAGLTVTAVELTKAPAAAAWHQRALWSSSRLVVVPVSDYTSSPSARSGGFITQAPALNACLCPPNSWHGVFLPGSTRLCVYTLMDVITTL